MEIQGNAYLITGGASLIGSHLADALLAAGAAEVRLLDNFTLGSNEMIAHLLGDSRVCLSPLKLSHYYCVIGDGVGWLGSAIRMRIV